jgi:hypothetical protein
VSGDWIESSTLIANFLHKILGGRRYTFEFESDFTKKIQKLFDTFGNSHFKNINKWNPSDFWITDDSSMSKYNLDDVKNLSELNDILLTAFANRDIIGISIKKVYNKVTKMTQVNYRDNSNGIKFDGKSYGLRSFFKSKDCQLFFDGSGVIQFRTFPSFQGEITGKASRFGKVGFSVINDALRELNLELLFDKKHLKKMIEHDYQYFIFILHQEYLKIGYKSSSLSYFKKQLTSKRTVDWLISKYLATRLLNLIVGQESEFINIIVRYAKSEAPLSSVHLQIK